MSTNWKEDALACNNRGHANYMEVKFKEAINDYTEAIKLDPNLAVAYYNRGTIYYRLGNYDEALSDLERATTLDPDNTDFVQALTDCYRDCASKNQGNLYIHTKNRNVRT